MKLEEFKAGIYRQQYQYKSFSPATVNHAWEWDEPKINTLLERATQALGELNAFSLIVPDVDMFIQMHIVKEASTSSRIEGTRTGIDEALMDKEQIIPEKRNDWQEVQNYIQAMNIAIKELETLPLSTRLLKKTHEILMQGVRGEHKTPGEFRRSQNWIGGTSLQDAGFIPPHDNEVPELMGDLEKFWYNESIDVPNLIRVAISHYQFETIHPFLDGNGRIGRLMITLYLVSKNLLYKPSLYLSEYFEKHRGAYYDALTVVRHSNDLVHWVKFFLVAVMEIAVKGKKTFHEILNLKNEIDGKIVSLGRKAEKARNLLFYLFRRPTINAAMVAKVLDLSPRSANDLIKDLGNLDLLSEITGYRRNRIFVFKPYLELFLN
ncbi:MAG: Fic family protein [Deltaproteobacteria bacterium]|nr:Fic family protein [Deltaproteobacteria bacterium]